MIRLYLMMLKLSALLSVLDRHLNYDCLFYILQCVLNYFMMESLRGKQTLR